jgi:hypothetical protein
VQDTRRDLRHAGLTRGLGHDLRRGHQLGLRVAQLAEAHVQALIGDLQLSALTPDVRDEQAVREQRGRVAREHGKVISITIGERMELRRARAAARQKQKAGAAIALAPAPEELRQSELAGKTGERRAVAHHVGAYRVSLEKLRRHRLDAQVGRQGMWIAATKAERATRRKVLEGRGDLEAELAHEQIIGPARQRLELNVEALRPDRVQRREPFLGACAQHPQVIELAFPAEQ